MMDEHILEEEVLLSLSLRRCLRRQKPNKTRKKATFWVRDILRKREEYGEYSQLV